MPIVAALLGASGPGLRLLGHSPEAQRSTWLLVATALVWALVLPRVPGDRWAVRAPILAAVAVGSAFATVPSVGRAPLLVALTSVTIAHAALVHWGPSRGWPERRTPVATLAVPLLVLAQVTWFRNGDPTTTLVLLGSAALVVEAYHRIPGPVERLDQQVRRGVGAVAGTLGAAALLVVALPLFYLPGAVTRLVGAGPFGRRRRAGSRWIPADGGPERATRDARMPFIAPDARTARRRHLAALAGVAVAAVAVGSLVGLSRSGDDDPGGAAAPGGNSSDETVEAAQLDLLESVPYSERPAMAGVDHADGLQADLAAAVLEPHPVTGYLTADTSTRYVNVADGVRRAIGSPCSDCPGVELWLVGASTVFGVGQRDDRTIAAELVRVAAEDGVDLRVTNLGTAGWTLHQEANWLRHQLRTRRPTPDLVVVMDGFNDVSSAVARDLAGAGESDEPLVFNQDEMVEALRSSRSLGPDRIEVVAERAASAYGAERDAVASDLAARGIAHRFFFQPDAFASSLQIGTVLGMYDDAPTIIESGELGQVVARTVARLAGRVEDLRTVYDDVDAPLFIDVVHTNEEGARIVAAAAYGSLRAELLRLASD